MKVMKHVVAVALLLVSFSAHAGIPTVDIPALILKIFSNLEALAQTAKQIAQYKTQLQQYQTDLRNASRPTSFIWDDASITINKVLDTIDTVGTYKRQAGDLNTYLSKYQSASQYLTTPCFGSTGCTGEQINALRQSDLAASDARKKSNDAVFKGLDIQQEQLKRDAVTLGRLQRAAEGAQGQLEAIQLANQLASHQDAQLMQIRTLMVQEQGMVAASSQAAANRSAKELAAEGQLRKGEFKKSDDKSW